MVDEMHWDVQMKISRIFPLLFFLVFSAGCNDIPKEIRETLLFEDVLHHYKNKDSNKEKRDAAKFLFRYMASKYSLMDTIVDSALTNLYDSIYQSDTLHSKNIVNLLKEKAPKKSNASIVVRDYSVIESNNLIDHIDITYTNWKNLSALSGASFADYCEYILPYRVRNEPLTDISTKLFEKVFKAFADTIHHTDSIVPAISNFIKSIGCEVSLSLVEHYPNLISAKHVYQMKVTPRCDDAVIFLSLALRSIGIPATYDFTPQWGNHHHRGHSWLAVKWQQEWYAFNQNGDYLNPIYQNESIPKVCRQNYSVIKKSYLKDVTREYLDVVDIRISIGSKSDNKGYIPAVAVFNKFKNFNIVDLGQQNGSYFTFKNLGQKVIYFIGGVSNGEFTPLTNPIYVDSTGTIEQLMPDWGNLNTNIIYRKYPLTIVRHNNKMVWAKSLSGSWFEASCDNFRTSDTLLVLNNYNSYKEEYFETNSNKRYYAVRFRCGYNTYVASLKFFDREHNSLQSQIVHDLPLRKVHQVKNLLDDDMLSWFRNSLPGQVVSIGYVFNEPQYISGIAVHARNDGNHIVIGDQYELMVYDNGWKSIGVKEAVQQEISFDGIPDGGLFWLKNLTRGSEELPFIFDADGNQFWVGQ